MSTSNTPLSLSSNGAAAAAKRKTQINNSQTDLMKTLGPTWKGMDGLTKSNWLAFAQDMASDTVNSVKGAISGYSAFVGIASTQVAAGGQVPIEAPMNTTRPAPLPGVVVQATGRGADLSIVLDPVTTYSGKILVYAARPLLRGQNVYKKISFKLLGSLLALNGPTEMGGLYLAHYKIPGYGYQIALRLVGVTPAGLRTGPLLVTGINAAAPAADLHLK